MGKENLEKDNKYRLYKRPTSALGKLSIKETKELLGDSKISDEEAQKIRDACYTIAELAIDAFHLSSIKGGK